jgi:branched-chain amino acid transport system permease protein
MMKRTLFWVVLLAVLIGLESTLRDLIGPYNYQILVLAGINIILAVSLNLINGVTGQFSIGHAGFYAIGAYTCALVVTLIDDSVRGATSMLPLVGQNTVLLLIGLAAGALAAGICGLLVGIPSLRLRGDYLAIVTLGFGEIIRVFILNIEIIGGARGFTGIPKLANFFWVYLAVAVTVLVIRNMVNSSYGRAFIAIRDDETAAEAMGVDTTRYKVLSFAVSSMFAGIAGGMFAHFTMYLHPNSFLFITSCYSIIMIVVGGLGSIGGAVLGAVLVTVLLEVFREFGAFRLVNFSILLVLIMIYWPQGLLGRWKMPRRRAGAAATK